MKEDDQKDEGDKQEWRDNLAAIKSTTKVYTTETFEQMGLDINEDLILAKLKPEEREFCIEQIKQALALRQYVPHEPTRDKIFQIMLAGVYLRHEYSRNDSLNTFLRIIAGVPTEEKHDDQLATAAEALKAKLTGAPEGPQ